MKFIIVTYTPTFYTRIISVSQIISLRTFVNQVDASDNSQIMEVCIELPKEIIWASFMGSPKDFWESWENDTNLDLSCCDPNKAGLTNDIDCMNYADELYRLDDARRKREKAEKEDRIILKNAEKYKKIIKAFGSSNACETLHDDNGAYVQFANYEKNNSSAKIYYKDSDFEKKIKKELAARSYHPKK